MFSEDTKKLMARDTAAYQAKQTELAAKLAAAIEGYPDNIIYSALHGALVYGFRQANGQWHPAPKEHNSEVVHMEPLPEGEKLKGGMPSNEQVRAAAHLGVRGDE